MIKFTNVYKSFTDDAGQVNALITDLNITFNPAEFTMIIGANGSGKSTLLNIIAGIVYPDKGTIALNQQEIQQLKTYERSKYIARIFQNPLQGSVAELTVMENMRLAFLRNQSKGLTLGISKAFRERVKHEISTLNLGLENKTEQKMGTLSGGQRQALTLVMATLCDAKVLLMDEPTAALDPKSAHSLMENAANIIKEKQLTTLMVTHNMREAVNYGNRLLMMKEGRVVMDVNGEEKMKLSASHLFDWLN
jgi:putative tryptophan/tyrosine transport system ATP-binding protein